MKYSLRLVESDSQIRKLVLENLKQEISETFDRAIPSINNQIKIIVRSAIEAQPEYAALTSGTLRLELGVPDAQNRIDSIINTWISNIFVEKNIIKITNSGLSGGFSLSMIASDFRDVLSLSVSSIVDDENGYSLPWLQWLLLDGGKVLVKDYSVVFGPHKASRTGFAIMKNDKSSSWRVPAAFAGTISNNWVTRAIDSLDDNINKIIQDSIQKAII